LVGSNVNLDAFKSFSDDAPLWIYAFGKPLDEDGRRVTGEVLSAFLSTWHSHNVNVDGAFVILRDRFTILTAASRDSVSGCSLDSVSVTFKSLRNQHGLDALDGSLVHYRDGNDTIRSCSREAFKAEVAAGRCGSGTIVFDLTVGTLGGLRAGRFEVPFADSWHAGVFLAR
jgi:hypothetical protein